ncbi:Fic family protein [Candidatus Woesearchaeota archaeon]|nr:Fic family protein [Candidatus Woesearchaeota archaeon]
MHIEKRQVKRRKASGTRGSKTKYYLAHAFRVDGKVRKIRVYLGADIKAARKKRTSAEQIIKERIRAYEVISDPFRHALNTVEIENIRSLEAKVDIKIRHLSEDDWKTFVESFVYDTNAIEGSSVTFAEVKDMLEKQEWPKEREKWEISETYGVKDAMQLIRNTKEHLSLELMKELHKACFRNSKPFAGNFREKGQEVAVVDGQGRIIHRGAPSQMVIKLLKDLVSWYGKNKKKYPPIVLAVVVHNQFETIHPFADGNGRVGRLLLNNILLRHSKLPVNIELKNRKEYYAALRKYQETGSIRPMIELILMEYKSLKKLLGK